MPRRSVEERRAWDRNRPNKAERTKLSRERRQVWRQTPEGKYACHRYTAKTRGIEWLFTFETWMAAWEDKFHLRGRQSHELVMARRGDCGPYSPQNVRIITKRENDLEREALKRSPPGIADEYVEGSTDV